MMAQLHNSTLHCTSILSHSSVSHKKFKFVFIHKTEVIMNKNVKALVVSILPYNCGNMNFTKNN